MKPVHWYLETTSARTWTRRPLYRAGSATNSQSVVLNGGTSASTTSAMETRPTSRTMSPISMSVPAGASIDLVVCLNPAASMDKSHLWSGGMEKVNVPSEFVRVLWVGSSPLAGFRVTDAFGMSARVTSVTD